MINFNRVRNVPGLRPRPCQTQRLHLSSIFKPPINYLISHAPVSLSNVSPKLLSRPKPHRSQKVINLGLLSHYLALTSLLKNLAQRERKNHPHHQVKVKLLPNPGTDERGVRKTKHVNSKNLNLARQPQTNLTYRFHVPLTLGLHPPS